MKIMNIKGASDFLTEEMIIRNKIIDVLKRNFEKCGYMPQETPILNYYDLLSYKYDKKAEILKEIYKLTDQGERNLGLRYDLTVPFCKVVALNKGMNLPYRRYEIGKVFRNGPVKLGRAREFTQCDADVVGIDNRLIEAEQILMVINIFNELNIPIIVKYNNRKLMSGLIIKAGIDKDKIDSVIGIIDKKEKVSKEELYKMLLDLDITNDTVDYLIKLFDLDMPDYEKISDNNYIKEGVSELKDLGEYLEKLNINDKCKFTPTLARGLSIYTGVVFEFFDKEQRLTCSLGGGGRYNKIITNFMDNKTEYPAIGLSFGLEPIYVILKEMIANTNIIDLYLVPLGTNIETLNIANRLRNSGYNVLIEMNNKKISKCFEYAEKHNIKYIMIIGDNEINTGLFKIKNMITKIEEQIEEDKLIEFIKDN